MATRDYRLLQRHRVNRVWRDPGFTLALPQQHGDWLVEQGIAEHVDGTEVRAALLRPPVAVATSPAPPPARFDPPPRFARRCCGWM